LTLAASAISTSHPARSSWSWTNRAPVIDSIAALIGSPYDARRWVSAALATEGAL